MPRKKWAHQRPPGRVSNSTAGLRPGYLENEMEQDDNRRPYTDEPGADYADNVAKHSRHYNLPYPQRQALGERLGPNWASILAGCGDQ